MDINKLDQFSTEEQIVLKWQYGIYGDFFKSLMMAIQLADPENLDRLALAFPECVSAVRQYRDKEGWWDGVRDRAISCGLIS